MHDRYCTVQHKAEVQSRTPPAPGGAEFLEAQKKFSGPNRSAPKGASEIFDRLKARRKIWPNVLRGKEGGGWVGLRWGGGVGGGGGGLPPAVPSC